MISSADAEQEWERFRQTFRGIKRRLLPSLAHIEADQQLGTIRRAFISPDPPEAAHRLPRMSSSCPVCGDTPASDERVAASIEPEYERGISVMIGAWTHPACLAACVETQDDRGVPW
jgi:hypothetical protein